MFAEKNVSLAALDAGQSGTVKELAGGWGLQRRLKAMGVVVGKKITKVSSMFMRGPVTLRVGHTQISLGHGMAAKIMVEIE